MVSDRIGEKRAAEIFVGNRSVGVRFACLPLSSLYPFFCFSYLLRLRAFELDDIVTRGWSWRGACCLREPTRYVQFGG